MEESVVGRTPKDSSKRDGKGCCNPHAYSFHGELRHHSGLKENSIERKYWSLTDVQFAWITES